MVAFDGVVLGDITAPCEVFGRAGYRVRVCGPGGALVTDYMDVSPRWKLASVTRAHTVVVPGLSDLDRLPPPAVLRAIERAVARGARVVSICTGAFVLAHLGVLDGRRATTHWAAAPELARRHPAVEVDPNVLYVDHGRIATSAGAAAGIDLCLHIVRRDCGASIAADVARAAVVPLERAGGQAQFVRAPPPRAATGSLASVLDWMLENLHRELGLPEIARRAAMSTRTLSRRFREQTGTTPAQWVARARVARAQHLLETTGLPIGLVAEEAGFRSVPAFRERFQQIVGTTPRAYRNAFRASP